MPGAAGVGVRVLKGERHAGVLGDRSRPVGELQGIGIEPGLQIEDKRPSGSERLIPLDSDVGLAQGVGREAPQRAIAVLLEEIFFAGDGRPVERRAMALPRHATVDRAVDRDAVPGQWAVCDDKVLKAATARRLQGSFRACSGDSLRHQGVVG